MMDIELIRKYNVPGPRYTSYPTVPNWNEQGFSNALWKEKVKESFEENKTQGLSIYIHLPFCESLCTFCGCHKHVTKRHTVEEEYIKSVLMEWNLYLNLFSEKPILKEIHLGGGTPTFFSPRNLELLIQGVLDSVTLAPSYEFSFEGHPNNTTEDHLNTLNNLGFTRVSFGVQCYSPKVQQAINRTQSFEQVKTVHQLAKHCGYSSISHDLVFGLPHQTLEDVKKTIALTNELKPDRISLYSYAHVPWIKGLGQRGFDEKDIPKDEQKRALYECAKQSLLSENYHEIGMDHFALEPDELYKAFNQKTLHRNFMGYTTNSTRLMIGLGMSAISDSWLGFAQNKKSVKEYQEAIAKGELAVFKGHFLSQKDLLIRGHILDLMCSFETTFQESNLIDYQPVIEKLKPLEADGLLVLLPTGVQVTEKGKVFVRNICMCFDEYLSQTTTKTPVFSKTI